MAAKKPAKKAEKKSDKKEVKKAGRPAKKPEKVVNKRDEAKAATPQSVDTTQPAVPLKQEVIPPIDYMKILHEGDEAEVRKANVAVGLHIVDLLTKQIGLLEMSTQLKNFQVGTYMAQVRGEFVPLDQFQKLQQQYNDLTKHYQALQGHAQQLQMQLQSQLAQRQPMQYNPNMAGIVTH